MSLAVQKNFDYFLDNDFVGYKDGEWVAIYESKIIAHSTILKKVMVDAKKIAPLSKVLFSRVKKSASFL